MGEQLPQKPQLKPPKPGLCCISQAIVANYGSFKSLRLSTVKGANGVVRLTEVIRTNMVLLGKHINYCGMMGWNLRIGSSLFPCVTHPEVSIDPLRGLGITEDEWDKYVRTPIRSNPDVRLSMHPDQFNVLGSDRETVRINTVNELNFASRFLDHIGARGGYESPLTLHMNCPASDERVEILKRSLERLDPGARGRLCFENEDKGGWNVQTLYTKLSRPLGIPLVFDNLHHSCNPGDMSESDAFWVCRNSWGLTRPLFHFSDRDPAGTNKRAHAEIPTSIPWVYGPTEHPVDIDIEFKGKDRAIRVYEALQKEPAA